jgi:hypothetical protein
MGKNTPCVGLDVHAEAIAAAIAEGRGQVRTLGEFANRAESVGKFIERHRARGGTHQGVLRALAFKWVRILYRCWVNKDPVRRAPISQSPARQKRSTANCKLVAVALRTRARQSLVCPGSGRLFDR